MKSKKSTKATTKDKKWQERIEKQVEVEKVSLNHPQGKERFERTVERISKKKSS